MAFTTPTQPDGNSLASVDEVAEQFKCVVIKGLAELLPLAHDRIATYERPRLRPALRGPHDDAGVVRLTKGLHVLRIPSREADSHDLHVLLRHRLLLQPHGLEALRPGQVEPHTPYFAFADLAWEGYLALNLLDELHVLLRHRLPLQVEVGEVAVRVDEHLCDLAATGVS
jgi:hypothetical protein